MFPMIRYIYKTIVHVKHNTY